MASSDIIKYHKEERFNLKRTRDRSVESSNKKLRMCESTGYFLEVRGKKNVGFFYKRNGRNFSSSRRSSYRSDRINYYSNSNGRNKYVKSKIESKKKDSKEEDSKKEKTDEIEEFLVWRPAPAREHSSEGFEVGKVIKAIEAPVKDSEGVEAVAEDNEGVGIVAEDNEGHEIVAEDNEGLGVVAENNEGVKRKEALERELKLFEIPSYAQTNKEEKILANDMLIAPLPKSRVRSRKNVDETDEGRRRGSGANDVTRASQPVRNRLSVHVTYGAKGDDEE